MKKFCDILYKILSWVNAVLLSLIIILVFMQVLNRFVFKIGMPWTQEISILCFIWSVFLGAAMAVRSKGHFFINIWPTEKKTLQRAFNVITLLIILAVAVIFTYEGYQLAADGLERFSRQLGMLMVYFLIPIPLSGGLIIIFVLESFFSGDYLKLEEEVDTL